MKRILYTVLLMSIFSMLQSCDKDGLISPINATNFPEKLSEYNIFQGEMKDLVPTSEYVKYELGSSLFTDFAHKQRLIKIPEGTKMIEQGNLLPIYPNGTIIVKTFYYLNDERDSTLGKRNIETRLLIKENDRWSAVDYKWNDSQTEAFYIESGYDTEVNFINKKGEPNVVSYHIPNTRECATCHNISNEIHPIGPKLRNLNIEIIQDGLVVNQLEYFQEIGILSVAPIDAILATPDYHNTDLTNEDRALGYLDINCAHCHSTNGTAGVSGLVLDYESTMAGYINKSRGDEIINLMTFGWMPRIGTTVLDEDGIEIIKEYVNGL